MRLKGEMRVRRGAGVGDGKVGDAEELRGRSTATLLQARYVNDRGRKAHEETCA